VPFDQGEYIEFKRGSAGMFQRESDLRGNEPQVTRKLRPLFSRRSCVLCDLGCVFSLCEMFARRVGRGVTCAVSVVRARSLCAAAGGNNLLGPEEAREFAAILIEARRQGKTVVLPEDANGMTVDDGYATQVQVSPPCQSAGMRRLHTKAVPMRIHQDGAPFCAQRATRKALRA
jgi:hypothetical protein